MTIPAILALSFILFPPLNLSVNSALADQIFALALALTVVISAPKYSLLDYLTLLFCKPLGSSPFDAVILISSFEIVILQTILKVYCIY
jgi:hypothetical protein